MTSATTVVTYGDSETAKFGWTDVLQADLGSRYTVVNTALSGQTSAWGLANLQANVLSHLPTDGSPAVVTLEFSMNDAVWMTLAQARANTVAMVQEILAYDPSARVFLVTNDEPSAAAVAGSVAAVPTSNLADVDAYYAQYRQIALQTGAGLIDLEPTWAAAQAADPSIVPDGYHPTLAADVQYEVPAFVHAIVGAVPHSTHGSLEHVGGSFL
jgi:lysophospholipase L1-like esterase